MSESSARINKPLLRVKRGIFGSDNTKIETPLRSELLSADQMEEHGKSLANTHTLSSSLFRDQYLLTRLTENESVLIEVRNLISEVIRSNRQIYPAAEWLLDNYYLIQDHIHNAKKHLPKSYNKELPRLRYGPSKGLPRVYDIALEMIAHGDGHVDPDSLSRFVLAYQSVTPLKLGELWAIPIMLRLTLIENLRRVAVQVARRTIDRNLANFWADKMIAVTEKNPKDLILVTADMARSSPELTTAFAVEFVHRLKGQSPALTLPLTWIEQQLAESGLSIERLFNLGNQQLAADQISIRNSIDSLRFMGSMDWKEFVETMSVVEQTMHYDPDGVYGRMDFTTRDNYRHIIENLARRSIFSENEVAQKAISLAQAGYKNDKENTRAAHVGYYLVDKGLPKLEKAIKTRYSFIKHFKRLCAKTSLLIYIGSILIITGIIAVGLFINGNTISTGRWVSSIIALIIFISAIHPAIALINWLSTLIVKPAAFFPRMDFSHGIPPESRTLCVIPSMLISSEHIETLIEALEVRFLANRDANLHFGLLTDFLDADKEVLPEDEYLVNQAIMGIEDLNAKYPGNTFFLFHRPRLWNPGERVWMGFERKRGKLADLNSLLLTETKSNFSIIKGNTEILTNVKYVITLDTDTQMPRDSARQFIGTMAHPLNKAKYDEKKHRVKEGYGIIQPRVGTISGNTTSRYANLFGSEPGIDPYTRAISDIYQDIFSEGSFIGKGIYDVGIFNRVFDQRFPDNRILSHDLLEGCYARSGLISDVQLFEEYPINYFTDVKRRHRWIRGDWQIFNWVLPYVRNHSGKFHRNPLSVLSKWKILDNLRRSVTSLALLLLLVAGWTILSNPLFWTLAVIGLLVGPPLIISIFGFFNKPKDVLLRQHLEASAKSAGINLAQAAFMFVCLPFEAAFSLDAIIRASWRIFISHRKLLEWNPSIMDEHGRNKSISGAYKTMWFSPLISIILFISLAIWWPENLLLIWFVPLLWLFSPVIVWWINNEPLGISISLSENQKLYLRNISRKTWAFFEDFVGVEDNWLPPDNFQEHPHPIVAHRTSPTNMGLSLMANLAAYDFGYINAPHLAQRTKDSFDSMDKLERYRGHFYNWYDTQTLTPLHPKYVSSVDSGNLAGNMMILKTGLLEIPDHRIFTKRIFTGISDTLRILISSFKEDVPDRIMLFEKNIELLIKMESYTLTVIRLHLEQLTDAAEEIENIFTPDPEDQSLWWAKKLSEQCKNALGNLQLLTPWISTQGAEVFLTEFPFLDEIPTFRELAEIEQRVKNDLKQKNSINSSSDLFDSFTLVKDLISGAGAFARDFILTIDNLAVRSEEFADIDYEFLYDKGRHLQNIGYNADERIKDSGFYDLLASEARLSTFIAIAQGKVPQESWFALNRSFTISGGDQVLLSWSGSMFEYLMPLLIMPTYANTLLDQTYKSVVKRQIEYGRQRGIPWGVSESGYNLVDLHLNYQYKAFGVPGMGLKQGLSEDIVIAPYATMLALMISPAEAYRNLERLSSEKMEGKYGFYEAMDLTPARLIRGQSAALVKSYMAHHQGMSLLSLAYLLLDQPMQKRFEADPLFQATLLLLQERIPKTTAYHSYDSEGIEFSLSQAKPEMPVRVITSPDTPIPEVHLLSNGRYNVMVTNAGGGYSSWNDMAVTRWREDSTSDNWGIFCYIKDQSTGEYWSTSHQPTLKKPEKYEAIYSKGRAEFRRRNNDIDTHTEIVVSPEDDIELRRVRITNLSRSRRNIEITSYAEVVLASFPADALHPAFSNLFVQTEIIEHKQTILCSRRPRSVEEKVPWMFHLMTIQGAETKKVSYETDRSKFIGRGNSTAAPLALRDSGKLSGTQGPVLDPIASIRYEIVLEPEESAVIDMVYGISKDRETTLSLADKYQDYRLTDRIFEFSWTYSQLILTQINATEADVQLYGQLASSLIYNNRALRAGSGIILANRRRQSGLWGYSISGDYPIVLLRIEDPANITLVSQLVQAHAYWRLKGLKVDLVIWNEDHAGYRQELNDQIIGLIAAGLEANIIDKPGGIFVRIADQISNEDKILIQAVARVIISDKRGSLVDQIKRRALTDIPLAKFKPSRTYKSEANLVKALPRLDLIFFNGIGGFTKDGREYVITTSVEQNTPAPWSNVLANKHFGSVVSDNGNGYTWDENAHEMRLTPWNNDPVNDTGGEAFYIRDEENGRFWSPTPFPVRGTTPYVSRHGFGYSVFEHVEDGIKSELWMYVAVSDPIKFFVLKLKNESGRKRRLSVTGYIEWVLGDLRPKSAVHVNTTIDPGSGAIFARNPYNPEFGNRTAFFQTDEAYGNLTCDRTEFIGRNRLLNNPAAMQRSRLSGKSGAGFDQCAAIQVSFDLADDQEREIIFRLGSGKDLNASRDLIRQFWGLNSARNALEEVWKHWEHSLGAIQIETPDQSVDIMINGWVLYQTIACRIWARSGYYQSGGAFGFRDQLQDMMAVLHVSPHLVREHLLLCASRQFKEGDVQHWWHPPLGRGVRTHCSDDYLWLPAVTSKYVLQTGDTGVLDEQITYLEGYPVNPEEESYYDLPNISEETETLYQHCVRAILNGLRFGKHGIPLMGTGDWNDGMNRVGSKGEGESVWLGFFLYDILIQFNRISSKYGDPDFAERCQDEAEKLKDNLDTNCWDGEWYLRAWFDDGTPLGSSENTECQIDSIPQSWSVLSGAGNARKSQMAMDSLDTKLVRQDKALIQLLDPPFDKSNLNPGYIKGYVPGVRENGGQYTHAAIWAAMAFAKIGDRQRAWELMNILNPVNRAATPEGTELYKVEPYVMAADIYGVDPHTGRGGWTWYTGSAGLMYRLVVESLLGLRLETDSLYINPCLPPEWNSIKVHYRYRDTMYNITILQSKEITDKITVDGRVISEKAIKLVNDFAEHIVEVKININT